MAHAPSRLDDLRWLLVAAAARALTWLPVDAALATGEALGVLAHRVAGRRRHIADVNLALCFPDLDAGERAALVARTFRSTGIAVAETALAWLSSSARLDGRVTFSGLEHLRVQDGRGVLLFGAHFSTLDIAGALLSREVSVDVVYRAHRNARFERLMARSRARVIGGAIERDDTRAIVRRLRAGRVVWYAADQDYGRRHSVFAPFFGVPAATITAGTRLARAGNARVLFVSHFRSGRPYRWCIDVQPLPDGFPSGDDVADATVLNAHIEREVRRDPAQYLWLHRRFKTRPDGEPRPY